jgi:hypothetical protein
MIVLNKNRFFSGGRWGVIQNASFRCALNTVHDGGDRSFTLIASFAGEWDYKNYEPIAEARLKPSLSRKQVMLIHDGFLMQLDGCGTAGADLGGAIEEVFGDAYNTGIVTRYENNAAFLLNRSD